MVERELVWRKSPHFTDHYTRGSELWLVRPDHPDALLGGIEYAIRNTVASFYEYGWYWWTNNNPEAPYVLGNCWCSRELHSARHKAEMALLRFGRVKDWPRNPCLYCGALTLEALCSDCGQWEKEWSSLHDGL